MNRFLVSLIVSIFIVISVQDGFAVIYRYVDDNGTVCFADRQQAIPDKYRGSAVIVNTEPADGSPGKGGSAVGKEPGTAEKEKSPPAEGMKATVQTLLKNRLLHLFASLLGFVLVFALIGKISSALNHKQVGSVLRILLIAGTMTYLLSLHAQEIGGIFTSLKEEVLGVTHQVEEKNKATDDMLKGSPGSEKY